MSGGASNGSGSLSYIDFARMYAPTVLPQAAPMQGSGLAALGQPQQYMQPQQGAQRQGQGQQAQQGGAMPFLGQLSQLGAPGGPAGQAGAGPQGQAQPSGLQQLLIGALNNNGANGNSNALANAVGFQPFGGGGWGSGS